MASRDTERREEEEDTGAQVAPIVNLEEVVVTGEEDEDVILELNICKLYRLIDTQWKKRGTGTVKLLKHRKSGRVRLLMRQSKTLRICANHYVLPTISIQEYAGNDVSCVWKAADFADGEVKNETFFIRFASMENCKTFKEKIREIAKSQQNKEKNKDASTAAGLLEKLTVKKASQVFDCIILVEASPTSRNCMSVYSSWFLSIYAFFAFSLLVLFLFIILFALWSELF